LLSFVEFKTEIPLPFLEEDIARTFSNCEDFHSEKFPHMKFLAKRWHFQNFTSLQETNLLVTFSIVKT
jgi:hypothetical protein